MGFLFSFLSFLSLSLSLSLITKLLIDWLEAVDYHGPLVTRYLMMRGERRGGGGEEGRGRRGGGVGKEGWKLDERGRLSHLPDHANIFFFYYYYSRFLCLLRSRAFTCVK